MALSGRRVLVTGGAGFIGSELVRQLVADGARVVVLDNLANGKRDNLVGVDAELVVGDIRDADRVRTLMQGCELVYHLAVLGVRHSLHAPRENHDVNATATLDLLAAARAAAVGRFVYVSSSEVYGTARTVPMTELHPTVPMTVYGGGKLAGECYTRAYFTSFGYPTVVVRPFNSFGPRCHHEGDSGEVIPKFMLRGMAGRPLIVFGDGEQTRDFTFVADTARGIKLAGLGERVIGETLNLGSCQEITVNALAAEVARVVGRQVEVRHEEPRPGDVLRLFADSTRAQQLIGFTPTVTLGQGLEALRDWYLARGESAEQLLADEVVHNWRGSGG